MTARHLLTISGERPQARRLSGSLELLTNTNTHRHNTHRHTHTSVWSALCAPVWKHRCLQSTADVRWIKWWIHDELPFISMPVRVALTIETYSVSLIQYIWEEPHTDVVTRTRLMTCVPATGSNNALTNKKKMLHCFFICLICLYLEDSFKHSNINSIWIFPN